MHRQRLTENAHTRLFALPGESVRVDSEDVQVLEWLSRRIPAASRHAVPSRTFLITAEGGSWLLDEDTHPSVFRGSLGAMTARLLERLNELACFTTPALTVHSGLAADHRGRSVWIPAQSGGGKSTLVAQLTVSGLRYATDEAVTVDREGWLAGWSKWLCIKPGGHAQLPMLEPQDRDIDPADPRWTVPPASAGEVVEPGERLAPSLIVFPARASEGAVAIEHLSRASAVALIAPQAFNLQQHGVAGIEALAAAVQRAAVCVRISYGDGWDGSKAVVDLLDSVPA